MEENYTDTSSSENNMSREQEEKPDFDDIGEYYFESDHLILKENPDYRRLLKTLAILEAQKIQAIRDLDQLIECEADALADPIAFVRQLQNKEDLSLPKPQKIADIPDVDWSQYSLAGCNFSLEKRQLTRHSLKTNLDSKQSLNEEGKTGSNDSSGTMVRGRPFNESKPPTFNQLWTAEEQKHLEELLIQYPPEEIESRRWEKIANALGNRTPTQVASRVQKYFIKLARAGLPVPGRMPSMHNIPRKPSSRRSTLSRYVSQQPSTFFASHIPPVYMNECDDDWKTSSHSLNCSIDGDASNDGMDIDSEDDGIAPELKDTPEYRELVYLKKLREERLRSAGFAQHVGFICKRCNVEPIIGTRWHCIECPVDDSVDFCSDCVDCMHECNSHTAEHKLEPIRTTQSHSRHLDKDYMHFLGGGDYNYLDPNYMPAS